MKEVNGFSDYGIFCPFHYFCGKACIQLFISNCPESSHIQLNLMHCYLESSPTTDAPLSTSDVSPSNPPVDSWEEEADKEHAEGRSNLIDISSFANQVHNKLSHF